MGANLPAAQTNWTNALLGGQKERTTKQNKTEKERRHCNWASVPCWAMHLLKIKLFQWGIQKRLSIRYDTFAAVCCSKSAQKFFLSTKQFIWIDNCNWLCLSFSFSFFFYFFPHRDWFLISTLRLCAHFSGCCCCCCILLTTQLNQWALFSSSSFCFFQKDRWNTDAAAAAVVVSRQLPSSVCVSDSEQSRAEQRRKKESKVVAK